MPKTTPPARRLELEQARARWYARSGLGTSVSGSIAEVVRATGWPRTLGGVDVYLAVRARVPGMQARDLEAAVERDELLVTPAVRGCIYVVPRSEVPLVMRLAEEPWRKGADRDLSRTGVSWDEVRAVAEAAVAALAKGPLSPDGLRKAMPAGTVRSLGEVGKKVGLSSPLPVALRLLEFEGRVERSHVEGRLDNERYQWRLPEQNPLEGASVPSDPVERLAELARVFFRYASPVSVKDFAEWAALSQRDARAAVERAGLVPVAVEGYSDDAFALEEDFEPVATTEAVSFLVFEDNYMVLHGGPALFTDPAYHGIPTPVWGSTRGSTLGDAKHVFYRAIVVGGTLVGFWEYDPDTSRVVTHTFAPVQNRAAIGAEAEAVGAFLRDQIGHARSFSLDTDDGLRERAAAIRAM